MAFFEFEDISIIRNLRGVRRTRVTRTPTFWTGGYRKTVSLTFQDEKVKNLLQYYSYLLEQRLSA